MEMKIFYPRSSCNSTDVLETKVISLTEIKICNIYFIFYYNQMLHISVFTSRIIFIFLIVQSIPSQSYLIKSKCSDSSPGIWRWSFCHRPFFLLHWKYCRIHTRPKRTFNNLPILIFLS